jgi:hypothetical protein
LTELDVASASAEPAHRVPEERPDSARWWALLAAVVAVAGLAVWVISPRFAIDMPSLVDDWASLSRSGDQLADLVRSGNSEAQRFVPALTVWNYAMWHTFDAPVGLVGPNAWNVVRALVLVAGLCLFTAVALPARRGAWNAVLDAALAAMPAFAVVTVPKFARDLARFGPQEPWLVGGMALGGALLVLAARSLLTTSRPIERWRTAALAVFGSGFWIMGVYHKETSVCVLPLIAAVVLVGWPRLREWRLLSTSRRAALGVLAAVVALPLAHVAIVGARIAARGDLIYGAEVQGGRDVLEGFLDLYDWAHEPLSENARLLMWGAIVLTAVASALRRRIDPIAVAALASGVLSLAFAGQSGVLATRYYIPAYALFAVAFALSLARLPTPVQVAGVLCVFLAFTPLPGTRDEVQSWTDEERAGAAVVREVRELESAGCTIAMTGVDPETTQALPVLVRLERGAGTRPCEAAAYFVTGPVPEDNPLVAACAGGALAAVQEGPLVSLHRCDRLGTEPVRDPSFGLVEPERLVMLHRFDSTVG